ncbi:MAG: hypothetical protein RL065_2058 [Bacteroidota bacterium]|jgi:hypothetical protein
MKKILIIALLSSSFYANAQGFEASKKSNTQNAVTVCSPFYFGLSMGINNPHGLLGFNFEMPVSHQFTFSPGIGISSWGTKFGGMIKYYTKPCCMGWAYGMGVTYNKGIKSAELKDVEVLTPTGTIKTNVKLRMLSQTNISLNAYKYWRIKNNSRFFIHAGLSFGMNQDKFDVTSGHKLSEASNLQIKMLSPGGLSLGLGFQFGTKY